MLTYKNNKKVIIGFLLPALTFYVLLMIAPVIETVFLSFFKWRGIGGSEFAFVGLRNYSKVLTDGKFWMSVGRLAYFVIFSVGTQMVIGFILAYIIGLGLRGSKFFKLSFFLPAVLSVTAISLMWRMILSTNYGMLNTLLESIGLGAFAKSWLTDPDICFTVITLINTWLQVGFTFVILLAGIVGIPGELFEAAEMDGANEWTRIFKITIPMIKEIIGVCLIMVLSNAMKTFDLIYVITNGTFGPGEVNMVPMGMMYITSFRGNDFGRGSVIAVFVMVVGAIVSGLIYFRGFKKEK